MLILNANDVRQALPMAQAIPAMKRAFAALSAETAVMPLRARLPISPHDGVSLFMPAFVPDATQSALAVKIVSVFNQNPQRNLPLIHAAVLVLEPDTGRPIALLAGGALTAIRTGAGAGAATDLLARPDSRVAAIFGAGVQSRTQLEAICTVRQIDKVWIYDPNPGKSAAFITDMAEQGPIPADLLIAESPQQAVREADIICTATTATTPVFADADLKPGVHINGVGSYTPQMQEIAAATVQRALLVVDSSESVWAEAGDLIQPLTDKLITADHIHAELGELVLNRKPGRTTAAQITFFKSVGVAVQDAAAAQLTLTNARALGLGVEVDL